MESLSSSLGSDKSREIKPNNFMHDCYRIMYLRITCSHTFISINRDDRWEEASCVKIEAYIFSIKKKGNLKFKRRLELGEICAKQYSKLFKSVKMHSCEC